jgi:pimeloyl-ACP methyl ester carboxylesterase
VGHGAWSAGWTWTKMHPLLAARDHRLITLTLTGLGERSHLANPGIDLDTHITDIVNLLEWDDLSCVHMIGHSYGGMVATGAADQAPARIAKLIYIDAFAPRDGDSVFEILPPATRDQRIVAAASGSESWRIPPRPMPPDTPAADVAWCTPKRVPQPLKTFEQNIRLRDDFDGPRYYVYCACHPADDRFRRFFERAQRDNWAGVFSFDASHNPHITAPDGLADLLDEIARE